MSPEKIKKTKTPKKHKSAIHIPVVPLKDMVVFPSCMSPLIVVQPKSIAALEAAQESNHGIFLVAQKSPDVDNPTLTDLHATGTIAHILQVLKAPDGTFRALVEGRTQACLFPEFDTNTGKSPYLTAAVYPLDAPTPFTDKAIDNSNRRVVEALFETYYQLSERLPEDLYNNVCSFTDSLLFIDSICHYSSFKVEAKQRYYDATTMEHRYQVLIETLVLENDLLSVQNKIITQVRSQIGNTQREYFLNEQLKAIEQELGVDKDDERDVSELAQKLEASKMPNEARAKATRELQRLSRMQPMSPESTVTRTYIEWMLDIPWGQYSHEQISLDTAQNILDEDHFGLTKIKERIVEFLAVHHLTKDVKGPILCLVGPPGVGKTSLAKSVARALGRRFVRMSLGGVRDEAEIRGHRRTYVGSLPGKIIQSMKKAETMNPVILLDEIDKMNSDFRGDPASALLEVLDPQQNKTFNDHYLEADVDLSKVLFLTTANTQSGIPYPLLDRMELLRLPGYTEDEKMEIAQRYLAPRQIKENGLTGRSVSFTKGAVKNVIDLYTREAGVRNLERELASCCRKLACDVVRNRAAKQHKMAPLLIDAKQVRTYLGAPKFEEPASSVETNAIVGQSVGLAWTEVGGEILPTEVLIMPGKGALQLTGKLGDVMQESAKAALSWIRAKAKQLRVPENFHKVSDIHIHIPEGAIPKDGPSAGITLVTALVSALSGIPVRQDLAMTGEITLRGRVLKIGGLKEKVLAAHRHHIRNILIPKDNIADLEDISPEILKQMNMIPISEIHEGLKEALAPSKKQPKTAKKTAQKSKRANA